MNAVMSKLSEIASIMGRKGGKNSVKNRFSGLTDKQISAMMSKVRRSKLSKKDDADFDQFVDASVASLNAKTGK